LYVSISSGTGGGDVDGGKSITTCWIDESATDPPADDLLRDPSNDSGPPSE
jgi:hypothetical protein